jgi:hypothetical protein
MDETPIQELQPRLKLVVTCQEKHLADNTKTRLHVERLVCAWRRFGGRQAEVEYVIVESGD